LPSGSRNLNEPINSVMTDVDVDGFFR